VNTEPLTALVATWRDEADLMRRRGLEREATMAESFATDLEVTLRQWRLEALDLETAAHESGYSYSTLQQRVAAGSLPNAGGKGRPLIRRCDLPRIRS
jgi:hypothetical protein